MPESSHENEFFAICPVFGPCEACGQNPVVERSGEWWRFRCLDVDCERGKAAWSTGLGEAFEIWSRSPHASTVSATRRGLPLDLGLIRWFVVCRRWQEMSAGHQPDLGAFLAGWLCRQITEEMPNVEVFRDSFSAGWREADTELERWP